MDALSDDLFDTSDLSKEAKEEKNKVPYYFNGRMHAFPIEIVERIDLYKQARTAHQQEWYDQINLYNARTALNARIKKIDKALNEQDKALLFLGTHHNRDGSVHMYEGNIVKLPLEVIKCIGEHIVTQPESPTTHVSERDIIKNARWITYIYPQSDREPYGIKGIMVARDLKDPRTDGYMHLSEESELGFVLRSHCYYKYRKDVGSARFRKSKYWNIELPLKDATHQKYGPLLYYFDEKGWEQDIKIRKQELL